MYQPVSVEDAFILWRNYIEITINYLSILASAVLNVGLM